MELEGPLGTMAAFASFGLVVSVLLLLFLALFGRRHPAVGMTWSVRRLVPPVLLIGPLFSVRVGLPLVADLLDPAVLELAPRLLTLSVIACVGWIVVASTTMLADYLDEVFPVDAEDNLDARRIHTRFQILRRMVVLLTFGLCGAAALMTFPGMRALGAGFLASAGIIGVVVGIAARPSVETLIAGIQMAWTQPLRLDDVLIVEGEWGRVEAIEATYVVVRLWDLRRLIVPIAHLLNQPFQNWTRTSADLLGAVTLEVDFRTDIDAVRAAAGRILSESPHFQGGFWNLQVVEAGTHTMRLRVLFDVPNADVGWTLRCEVRERLVKYFQEEQPDRLPRFRAELVSVVPEQETSAP